MKHTNFGIEVEGASAPPPQWEKGGNFKKLKMSKITRYNVYGL